MKEHVGIIESQKSPFPLKNPWKQVLEKVFHNHSHTTPHTLATIHSPSQLHLLYTQKCLNTPQITGPHSTIIPIFSIINHCNWSQFKPQTLTSTSKNILYYNKHFTLYSLQYALTHNPHPLYIIYTTNRFYTIHNTPNRSETHPKNLINTTMNRELWWVWLERSM